MEGSFLIPFLAVMGGISLYVVIATIVGKAVYSRTNSWDEDTRFAAAIFCGFLFPISVPIIVFIIWIWSIIRVPIGLDKEKNTDDGNPLRFDVIESRVRNLEEVKRSEVQPSSKPKTKFKAGDLITGVSGNPGNYNHLYEGCVCRVLSTDGDKAMNVVLIGHIDFNAQSGYIGTTFKAPPRHFTLIKPKANTKKVAKKKKK